MTSRTIKQLGTLARRNSDGTWSRPTLLETQLTRLTNRGDYSVGGANNNGVNGNLGLDETGSGGSTASLTNGLSNGTKREEANGHAAKRVKQHGVGGAIVELGAGSLKKTAYLLQGVAGLLGDNEDGQLKTAQYIAVSQTSSTLRGLSG